MPSVLPLGDRLGGREVLVVLMYAEAVALACLVLVHSFAATLGLELLPSGCVAVDAFGHTSLPGVYAAGDLAHQRELPMPLATVLNAAAAGLTAAAASHRDLLAEQIGA